MKTALVVCSIVFASSAVAQSRSMLYSPDAKLLAETVQASVSQPAIEQEYIWFENRPVAQFDGAASEVRWTFSDHLATPLLQTSAAGAIAWRAEAEPYGEVVEFRAGAALRQPLRFPGQEAESGGERTYNQQRWYRAGWGRYTQSDPIGLAGGENLFAYAFAKPIDFIDPTGLRVELYCQPVGAGGDNAVRNFAGNRYQHCYVRVTCDKCPAYDLRLEVTGDDNGDGLADIPAVPRTFNRHEPKVVVPISPPDYDDAECEAEECILRAYEFMRQRTYPYPSTGFIFGPNSNTFANTLLRVCGFSDIAWPEGVSPLNY